LPGWFFSSEDPLRFFLVLSVGWNIYDPRHNAHHEKS